MSLHTRARWLTPRISNSVFLRLLTIRSLVVRFSWSRSFGQNTTAASDPRLDPAGHQVGGPIAMGLVVFEIVRPWDQLQLLVLRLDGREDRPGVAGEDAHVAGALYHQGRQGEAGQLLGAVALGL